MRALVAHDRLALLGVAAVAVSLLMPWHGVMAGDYVKTPASSTGFIELAIVLTLAAAAYPFGGRHATSRSRCRFTLAR